MFALYFANFLHKVTLISYTSSGFPSQQHLNILVIIIHLRGYVNRSQKTSAHAHCMWYPPKRIPLFGLLNFVLVRWAPTVRHINMLPTELTQDCIFLAYSQCTEIVFKYSNFFRSASFHAQDYSSISIIIWLHGLFDNGYPTTSHGKTNIRRKKVRTFSNEILLLFKKLTFGEYRPQILCTYVRYWAPRYFILRVHKKLIRTVPFWDCHVYIWPLVSEQLSFPFWFIVKYFQHLCKDSNQSINDLITAFHTSVTQHKVPIFKFMNIYGNNR